MDANANQIGSVRLRHRRGGCKVPPRQTPNSPGADVVGTSTRDGPSVVATRSVGKGEENDEGKRNGLSSTRTPVTDARGDGSREGLSSVLTAATDGGSVAAGTSQIGNSTADGLSSAQTLLHS